MESVDFGVTVWELLHPRTGQAGSVPGPLLRALENETESDCFSIDGTSPMMLAAMTKIIGVILSTVSSKFTPTSLMAAIASRTAKGAISHPSGAAGAVLFVPVFCSIFFPSKVFARQQQG